MAIPEYLLIVLDTTDSTNNYAMRLIDANKAHHGMVIAARNQLEGKGQRGKTWLDAAGESLLMSIIVLPNRAIHEQFSFSAAIAVAIAKVLQNLNNRWDVRIKWPNDLIINDKKAGGILIENVLRGSQWTNSVIGLGLNVKQLSFPGELPFATSLKIASEADYDLTALRNELWSNIMDAIEALAPKDSVMREYNELLYKHGAMQGFSNHDGRWEARILTANSDGTLAVQLEDGTIVNYQHGQIVWEWN